MTFQLTILGMVLAISALIFGRRVGTQQQRLAILLEDDPRFSQAGDKNYDWNRASKVLTSHTDFLGRAGLLTAQSRRNAWIIIVMITVFCSVFSLLLASSASSTKTIVLALIIGFYSTALIIWCYLRYLRREYLREVLFCLPLTLESLILLVETGLGILPSIEQLVRTAKERNIENPITYLLELVYNFSSNSMELSDALELVAHASPISVVRHTLLHLDLSGNEGGEIIPSLRSLSDHAHKEWRLSVEHRVRRLENLVVFPVFVSVIGLLLLTAAVPLVPVLELRDSLKRSELTQTTSNSNLRIGR